MSKLLWWWSSHELAFPKIRSFWRNQVLQIITATKRHHGMPPTRLYEEDKLQSIQTVRFIVKKLCFHSWGTILCQVSLASLQSRRGWRVVSVDSWQQVQMESKHKCLRCLSMLVSKRPWVAVFAVIDTVDANIYGFDLNW